MTSRREFLRQLGGSALGAALPIRSLQGTPASAGDIKVGCAAITWGGDDHQAIADISALRFPGIQLRANAVTRFREQPGELRDLLARHNLTFVALSSGNVSIDPSAEAQVIEQHVGHARFLRDAGGLYLQLIDQRPSGREPEPADYARLGRLLTEIGKRTADLGVPVGYHHHVGSLGEKPGEIEHVLDAADPRYVRLLLDVAHYHVGGGDPIAAIRRYADRLLFLHIKDVRVAAPGASGPPFRFVELGRGSVDLEGVFAALREVDFGGWAIVELDSVPDPERSPKEANAISKRYLERVIGLRVS
ncbi:MAG: sugar phosphate isomerase/epimerase [Gemmatimonadota bacterium]|nr:sugar phosphate isomerase/epimerase [Gemmatimonadota bacterium]